MPEPTAHRLPTPLLALVVPVVAAVAVIVTLAATSPPSTGSAAHGGGGTAITIENFAFTPPTLRVAAGTTVRVTNADGAKHTLAADGGAFDTGTLDGGATATVTIDRAGTYRYYCDIHNYMTGRIEAT